MKPVAEVARKKLFLVELKEKILRHILILGVVVSAIGIGINVEGKNAVSHNNIGSTALQSGKFSATTSITLDGVNIDISFSGLPSMEFVTSQPGSASQIATSVTWEPFKEFTILAIPYGSKPGTEKLPLASPGGEQIFRTTLREFRQGQGGFEQPGTSIAVFKKDVTGSRFIVNINLDNELPTPVAINEWVVEAGGRLWVIRLCEEVMSPQNLLTTFDMTNTIVLESMNVNSPTTLVQGNRNTISPNMELAATEPNLPKPSWWTGDCDYSNYVAGSNGIESYRLGEVYLGTPACGPRPYYDGSPDVLVRFYTGSWGVYEWECVEYVMRFMYLLYGIVPYQANGSQVVWNYNGELLAKIRNGTVGQVPMPNDILSYGSTSSFGHTSVVTASRVDGSGNGTIDVIEENANPQGKSILSVKNWIVYGNAGTISGWLHAGWHVQYFTSNDMTKSCFETYEDSNYIFKALGNGFPVNGCNPDQFSTQISSVMNFSGGNYTFNCQHNDGCRVIIDGQVRIDSWSADPLRKDTWSGPLAGGNHEIEIDYDNLSSIPQLEVFWTGPGFLPESSNCSPGEWCGSFFGNQNLTGSPVFAWSEDLSNISHNWGENSIGYGLPEDHFSISWKKTVHFNAGEYRFHIKVDDGGRLWLNDHLFIDQWKNQGETEYLVTLKLDTNDYEIRFDYYDYDSNAKAAIWWESIDPILTVKMDGTGSGNVQINPAGMVCLSECSLSIPLNSTVLLSATPDSDSTFIGWDFPTCLDARTCSIAINSPISVTATFTKKEPPYFNDVPYDYSEELGGVKFFLHNHIQILFDTGITSGISTDPPLFGPQLNLDRAMTSVFILRAHYGKDYQPPPFPWPTFVADDWTINAYAQKWAEGMWATKMTAGCQLDPLKFCPDNMLTRVDASIFALRIRYDRFDSEGNVISYVPPAASNPSLFADMEPSHYGTAWAEQAYKDGLLPDCGLFEGKPLFCPDSNIDRAWTAYLIVRALNLLP